MKKKFILFFIMFGAFIPFVNASEVNKCKVSESYLYWVSLPKEEKSKYIMPEYCESNGIEDYNFNTHENKKLNDPSYPPYYLSVSTPVRNQSVTPACWAFAATTVLESHILKQYGVNLTFSRGHLNYFESQSFNDITSNKYGMLRDVNDGGNHNVSSTYYINRHGPVLESEFKTDTESDPLPRINSKTVLNKKNYLDVDNIEYEYRSKSGACTDREISKIKGLLMEYGPTGADIYMDFDLALESGAYITKSDNNMALSNHAVTIVGWDDNYSLDNFEESTYKPVNPGAWIIQNSYGNDFGDNGLMYISYEDDQVCTNLFSIRSVDASTEDNNYVNSELKSNITVNANAGMSVFKKKTTTDEYLTKVSFEVNKPTSYNVYYYPSNASGKKLSEMIKIASGSVDYKGWVTVKPDKSIVIPSDVTEYSIAVNIANSIIPATGKTQLLYDQENDRVSSAQNPDSFKKKNSYVYVNKEWKDLYNYYKDDNYKVVINSFTDNVIAEITGTSVKYSKDDYFDAVANIKANYNGVISKVELLNNDEVISYEELDLNVEAGKSYSVSTRVNDIEGFVNGTYQIRVYSSNGIYRFSDININVIPINGINITNEEGLRVPVNESVKLNAEILPLNFNSLSPVISWSSSNDDIASVNSDGVVSGVSVGDVIITARTINGKEATYLVNVYKPITEIGLSRPYVNMEVGDEEHIYSYVLPLDTTEDKTLKWTSSDDAKAIIEVVNEEEVIVKALSSGIVTITSESLNGVKKSIDVYIKGISLDPRELKLELKNSYDMNGILIDDKYSVTNNVTWESENPKVAVVDSNGRVSAKTLGTTKIKITDELGNIAESIVTIIKIQVKHFTVSEVGVKEYSGKKIKPSVTVKYNGSKLKKDKDYTVSYSNNKTVGKATIKIKAKKTNLYEGSKKVYFIIKPEKISIKTPSTKKKTITVSWYKHPDLKTYEVAYRLKGSSEWSKVKVKTTSYKIESLKKNKNYEVKVRGYIKVDDKNYYGAWSKTKTIKCK